MRHLVSKKKRRFEWGEFDLDLTCIFCALDLYLRYTRLLFFTHYTISVSSQTLDIHYMKLNILASHIYLMIYLLYDLAQT